MYVLTRTIYASRFLCMNSYIARHSVAVFAISSALLGLGMGASSIHQLSQYESVQR